MNDKRSVAARIAAVLLGVTAAGAALFALAVPVIGLVGADLLGASQSAIAQLILVAVGVVSLAFAVAAGFAARAVHGRRPAGTLVGLGVGVVLILGPAVASASGGWHPALIASYAIGGGILTLLSVPLVTEADQAKRS